MLRLPLITLIDANTDPSDITFKRSTCRDPAEHMIRFPNTLSLISAWHNANTTQGPDFTWTCPNNNHRHFDFVLDSESIQADTVHHHYDDDLANHSGNRHHHTDRKYYPTANNDA